MKNLLIFLLTVLLFIISPAVYADDGRIWTDYKHYLKFDKISIDDGLSHSTVLCIFQDSRGFVWFGTEDGLNRYDGYSFINYKPEPENPFSLNNNCIFSIGEDRDGALWIGTNGGGVNRFDRKKEKFFHYKYESSNPLSLSNNIVNIIYRDRHDHLWIGTSDGLNRVIPGVDKNSSPKFIRFMSDTKIPKNHDFVNVSSIYEDQYGILWIGTEGSGLNKMIQGKDRADSPVFFHYRAVPGDPDTIGLNDVMAINEDQFLNLWMGTKKGIYRYQRENDTFILYRHDPRDAGSLSHNFVREIYRDRSDTLWFGTDGGGLNKLIFDEKRGIPRFLRHKYDPSNPNGLSDNAIEAIFEDSSGVLWIGTYNGGINKLVMGDVNSVNREKEQFVHYQNIPNNNNSLSHNSVNAICEDHRGFLWVGTDGGGLNKIVPGEKPGDSLTFVHYHQASSNSFHLSDDIILCIHEDRRNNMWIGTYTGGLNRLIPVEGGTGYRFRCYRHDPDDPDSLSNNFVMTVFEDSRDVLWVGTIGGGLNRYDREDETFDCFKTGSRGIDDISNDNVMSIYEDRHEILWIGTVEGLNRFDRQTGKFTVYMNDPGDVESLSNHYIRVIYEDRDGILWAGTDGGGLNRIVFEEPERINIKCTHFTEKNGLSNNVILGIVEDRSGMLWLSTNKGISRFNKKTGTFTNYHKGDGLQGNQFNQGAFYKSRSGEIFFGGDNGMNVFHPANIKKNTTPPQVVLTDFQLFNKSVPIGQKADGRIVLHNAIGETESIALTYRDRIISFQFAALHFVSPGKNRYAYYLDGFDTSWNHIGNRRFATYTTLPPGEYVFRVKAANNDGFWNDKGTALRIKISPPFWKTWWFSLLVVLLILMVIVSIHLIRVRHIIIRERKKYEKTPISMEKSEEYFDRLIKYMESEKPYLQPNITLHRLSNMVEIPYFYLSQIINKKLKLIFFDFINQYRIKEAIGMLSSQSRGQKSINEISREVGFNSQSAFNRSFKKHAGKTPSEYINESRIIEAMAILRDKSKRSKTLSEIAREVGYNSQSAFTRAFKKHTKNNPLEYRKKHQK